jgi:hypothetical protein
MDDCRREDQLRPGPFYGFAVLAAGALAWSFFRVRVALYVVAAVVGLMGLLSVPLLVFA